MVKRLLVLNVAFFMLCGTLLGKVPVQHKIRLNDNWIFLRQDIGNIWEAVRPVKAGQPEEVPLWQPVTLPHCFNAEDCVDPDVNYYQGPGWYKTQLSISNPYADGRVMLEFEGAGQKTDVYVYTTKVGSHVGGYDSWNVDITDAVNEFLSSDAAARFDGKVPLSIRCDNSRDAESIPSDLSDFNLYGGLYRYLNLVYLPAVSVGEISVMPELSDDMRKAKIKVYGAFYNPEDVRTADVCVTVKSPDGKVVATGRHQSITPLGRQKLMEVSIDKPQIWDVDNPRSYTCEVSVKANGDEIVSTEHFGLRKIEFIEKGPFHLNGRRLLLRGTHRHEDHAGVAAAMTEEMMRQEMAMMKEMGVNFIRLGHYQQSEIILDLCDELGILVWEEIPWCRGGVGGDVYREQGRRMLTNMINQHYNHPSVIIWGLGNENDWPNDFPVYEQRDIRAFMSELNTLAHHLDPSRKTAIRRCDFCSDIVDVYSPTIWAGWYRGKFTEYQDFSRQAFDKVKHFLHVEWGGDSHPGRHVEDSEPTKNDWSETYVIKLIDWHLKEQENMPWLTGAAYWPFKDFATPVRPENPVPYVNQKGVIERDFTKKEAYYVFQSYWTDTPMAHIIGHSQPVRWGDAGEEKEILVYSNCPQVELFVNGKSQGIRKRDSQNYPAAGLRWNVPLEPGQNTVKAVAVAKDKSVCEDEVEWTYQTEKWGKENLIEVTHAPLPDGMERIDVRLVDKNGVPCLDSHKVVRFELAGDGELIKNQGTAGGSAKVEVANGRASVKMKKGSGKSVVAVKSDNLETQFITI
ncbi:MAG: glycoside hydrolase family 2 protein [Bacteroides sp.]|nr:glycoside hydrolase family 2 protein [Bacteroides sp.]